MKTYLKTSFLIMLTMLFALNACTDDDDDSISQSGVTTITPSDQELITTVQLLITDTLRKTTDTVEFSDPDGQGGNAPSIDTIKLENGKFYEVSVKFLDESDPNDVEDITVEILAEADEHLLCYEVSPSSAIGISTSDTDGTYPLGLSSNWMSMSIASGSLTLTLKHQPGVKNGSCDLGDTDVEATYPLVIQ